MIDEKIINKLDQGILVVDQEGNIIFANQYFLEKLQYRKLKGSNIMKILWEESKQSIEKLVLQEETELILRSADNKMIKAEVSITNEQDKGQLIYWFIVKEWDSVKEVAKELNDILDCIPYAIWIEDLEGNYLYANQPYIDETNFLLKTKYTKNELRGRNTEAVWKERFDRKIWKEDNKNVLSEKTVNEYRYLKGESSLLPYMITKLPIKDDKGQITKIACIKDNRAQRKQIEETLLESYGKHKQSEMRSILEAKGKAVQKIKYKSDGNNCYLGAETMVLLDYDKEEKCLKMVSSISNMALDLSAFERIAITEEKFEKECDQNKLWQKEYYDQRLTTIDLSIFFNKGIKYVAQYSIKYNEQLLGIFLVTYKNEAGFSLLNKKELSILCGNIGTTVRNIKLVEQVEREFFLREKAENQLQDLFGTTIGLYSVYDFKQKKKLINVGWDELLDWEKDKPYEKELIHKADREDVILRMTRVEREHTTEESVSRFRSKKGGYRWIKWKAKMNSDGTAFIIFGIDVTDEIKVAEERNAFQKALELEASKSEFIANMSHELKTPLNILYGALQLMDLEIKGKSGEQFTKVDVAALVRYRNLMKQNVFRLLRLINNIVDSTRIGAGGYKPNMQNCNIVEIVEDITQSVVDYVHERHLSITFDTEVEEIEMACDVEKIERIMLNLLSNAIKYSSENGKIMVRMFEKDKQAVITVSDDGIGIAKDKQKDIFKQFVQVDQSFTRCREGSGIGLALVKSLVEMHKGTIDVQSELGVGTTFTVCLPIYKVTEEEEKRGMKKITLGNSRIEKCNIEFSDIYEVH